MEISYVADPESSPLWSGLRALLQPAADLGEIEVYEPGDLLWMIYDGPVAYAAFVTRLLPGEEAEVRLAGGCRSKDWLGLLDETVTAWARDCGAYRITWRGRDGWRRYAAKYGWAVLGQDHAGRTLYMKELA